MQVRISVVHVFVLFILFIFSYLEYVQGGPKSNPDNFCNNFVYCKPMFIIFDTYTL